MITQQRLIENFLQTHPADAAGILERHSPETVAAFLSEISPRLAVQIMRHLERFTAVRSLELMPAERSAGIIQRLPLEVAALFLRRMSGERSRAILEGIDREISEPLGRMLRYPADMAGALVDPLVFTLPVDLLVKEALRRLQARPEKILYYIYIVDRNHALSGVINMRELMLAPPDAPLAGVMHTKVISIWADALIPEVLDHPGWTEFHALPVIDRTGILLGVIRYETMRHMEKEMRGARPSRPVATATNALGELYRIGLIGLIRGFTEPALSRKTNK